MFNEVKASVNLERGKGFILIRVMVDLEKYNLDTRRKLYLIHQ